MLTIGQLTRHTGVPARTIRFYHAKGILPEPARDQSSYRRYTAHDAATLIKILTMGAAGVPLADIQRLLAATPEQLQLAVSDIEHRLDQRIQELQDTRIRLRELATGSTGLLPTGVCEYLDTLRDIGLSDQWIAMESELWILLFATHPDTAEHLLADQHQAKTPVSVLMGWLSSVVYVSALSLWALVSGHWSAWQAARVEVGPATRRRRSHQGGSTRRGRRRSHRPQQPGRYATGPQRSPHRPIVPTVAPATRRYRPGPRPGDAQMRPCPRAGIELPGELRNHDRADA